MNKDLLPDVDASGNRARVPILPDQELENLVRTTLTPLRSVCVVRVGWHCVVYKSLSWDDAERVTNALREEIRRGVKRGIRRLTHSFCDRCRQGETPKRIRTRRGLRLYHKDKLGKHPCLAEHLWLALIRDTTGTES
jgi:hypothetical protein